MEKLKRNVEVKVIILNDLFNRSEFGLDYGYLANHGADIRFASLNGGTMHHKYRVKEIPEELLCIKYAKMYFYKFPMTSYGNNDIEGIAGKATSSINVFGIAKEIDGDCVVFYEGWNPQKRGEIIQKECFQKSCGRLS